MSMAMVHVKHSEPYIECFSRNMKTLETKWISGYLRLSAEQHCLLMNGNRETIDWLRRMRSKHQSCSVHVRLRSKSCRECCKAKREDEQHRNRKLCLKEKETRCVYQKENIELYIRLYNDLTMLTSLYGLKTCNHHRNECHGWIDLERGRFEANE